MLKVTHRYPETVYVDGSEVGIPSHGTSRHGIIPYYLIVVDGSTVLLSTKMFKLFAVLAWHRLHSPSGWVFNLDIERFDNASRYLYRLRNQVKSCLSWPWQVHENNHNGYYRLYALPETITINTDNFKLFPDSAVTSLIC